MADNTVFEMEIEGEVYPVEDKTARARVLVPTLNADEEITALKDSGDVSHGLADTVARQELEKLQSYSTAEQDTGKTWIDGKPIYRKTILTTAPTSAVGSGYASVGAPIDNCVGCFGFLKTSVGINVPVGLTIGNSGLNVYIYTHTTGTNADTIRLMNSNSSWDNNPTYITVEYTKTTD